MWSKWICSPQVFAHLSHGSKIFLEGGDVASQFFFTLAVLCSIFRVDLIDFSWDEVNLRPSQDNTTYKLVVTWFPFSRWWVVHLSFANLVRMYCGDAGNMRPCRWSRRILWHSVSDWGRDFVWGRDIIAKAYRGEVYWDTARCAVRMQSCHSVNTGDHDVLNKKLKQCYHSNLWYWNSRG